MYTVDHISPKYSIPLIPVVCHVVFFHTFCGALWLLLFQVDSSETLSDSDADAKALTEVHSIGVQVEDDKR